MSAKPVFALDGPRDPTGLKRVLFGLTRSDAKALIDRLCETLTIAEVTHGPVAFDFDVQWPGNSHPLGLTVTVMPGERLIVA